MYYAMGAGINVQNISSMENTIRINKQNNRSQSPPNKNEEIGKSNSRNNKKIKVDSPSLLENATMIEQNFTRNRHGSNAHMNRRNMNNIITKLE